MSETKLKPCPFCGGEVKAYADNHNKVMISCDNCNMYFGIELEIGCELEEGWKAIHKSKEEAIEKWNTRKPMDNIVEQLEKESDFFGGEPMGSLQKAYYCKGIVKAIDIVRKGGVE